MKPMVAALLLCLPLSGCAVAPPDQITIRQLLRDEIRQMDDERESTEACPPLPRLSEQPTPYERRLFTLTLIALYEQCAKNKK